MCRYVRVVEVGVQARVDGERGERRAGGISNCLSLQRFVICLPMVVLYFPMGVLCSLVLFMGFSMMFYFPSYLVSVFSKVPKASRLQWFKDFQGFKAKVLRVQRLQRF